MSSRGRVIMYFDNSNIFQSQRDAGWRIDVEKFFSKVKENGDIWQTYFFAAVTDPPRFSQTSFYKMLKNKLRWETVIFSLGTRTSKCKKCNKIYRIHTEKGVDVAIATTLLTHAINKAFDTAILVSGDKDYLETVKTVKKFGLRVEIVSFRNSLSQDLARESSSPVLILDDIKKDLELMKPDEEAEQLINVNGKK